MSAPRNMPPWHTDYFKSKTIKTQQTQEDFLPLPYLPNGIQKKNSTRKGRSL